MVDIALSIQKLVPGANYTGSVTGNKKSDYDAIVWNDARAKPSWKNIQDADALPFNEAREKSREEKAIKALVKKGLISESEIDAE